MPFYVFMCYLNEIDVFDKINLKNIYGDSEIEFNKGFIDNVLLIVFLGILFTKGLVQNVIFYYRLIIREKHLTLT